MSRYKTEHNKLIIAALVLLLCLVSITGATLALFFSDVNDGTIGINATAGNIKVDIVDIQGENSLVGEVLAFKTKEPGAEVLFEPGATYHTEGFRVKNTGEIPLDYILYISEDDSVSEDFADAFDVWIVTDPDDAKGAVELKDFDGELAVGDCSQVYYLVFRMKTSAGNEYQDRTFSGVGVTVCAVQGNAIDND